MSWATKRIAGMVKWADEWQMELNPEKCEVIHFGRCNLTRKYSMNGKTLGCSEEQRDIDVFVHRSLKAERQVYRHMADPPLSFGI